MPCPIPGLTIPVDVVRVIDADTLIVRSRLSGREITVRLAGCDAPEKNTAAGREATQFVEEYLDAKGTMQTLLHVAWPEDRDGNGAIDTDELLRQLCSFERVVGSIWVGGYSLAETLMVRGLADAVK